MATDTKNVAEEMKATVAPEEKKKLKRLFVFQQQEYDLDNLTDDQKKYLKKFPDQVPFVK